MKTYFTDILEKGENGLYLCQMPTGSGKTYSVVEAIKDYVK
jgi:type II secretory ATPase GspE/PulE/Tfp pilus assembly ATPase PilB-like protein